MIIMERECSEDLVCSITSLGWRWWCRTRRDNGLSWRKENKQGSCGLLKKENSALGWEGVLRFNRLLFALYPWGLGDKSSHFRLVRLLLFGLLLWVRITTTSVAFCSDHSLLNTPAPVKFFLPVKHYRLTRGPPGLSLDHTWDKLWLQWCMTRK